MLSCKKRSWSHPCFSHQHYENIFQSFAQEFELPRAKTVLLFPGKMSGKMSTSFHVDG